MRSVADAVEMIEQGKTLLLAGDEALLAQLPAGSWIAGTTVSFMTKDGGTTDRERLFVTDLSDFADHAIVKRYKTGEIPYIATDYSAAGFTVLIVPSGSEIHASFAKKVRSYEGVFNSPLLGWVSGVDISEARTRKPKVFAGTSEPLSDEAVAIHVTLPLGKLAHLEMINLFAPGDGDVILFHQEGFSCDAECTINDRPTNFASYIAAQGIDIKLPLVANYNGTMTNVSIQSVDVLTGKVQFYAPVFPGVEYRIASPMEDYTSQFEQYMEIEQCMQDAGACETVFSCNCILNFLYAGLQGKKTGSLIGPVTYGEIAYMLLNQTLVYLKVTDTV
jgi:hypothetical protein